MPTVSLSNSINLPCGVSLKNRIAKAAMSENFATNYCANTKHVNLYKAWANGGPGLLISGNIMIDKRALGEPVLITSTQSTKR